MNKSRREIIIQFLKFISETKLIFRFLDSRQESDTKLVSFFRSRSRRDAFRLVPQTVEFRLRRPTRRQGVAWPRFRAARIPFFFLSFLPIHPAFSLPFLHLLRISPPGSNLHGLRAHRQLVIVLSLFLNPTPISARQRARRHFSN